MDNMVLQYAHMVSSLGGTFRSGETGNLAISEQVAAIRISARDGIL
jgi:hypothetical protein